MQDDELKKLLSETCPVLPGQEARAWAALRERMQGAKKSGWSWIYLPSRVGFGVALTLAVTLTVAGQFYGIGVKPFSIATAEPQAPGIYATSFYSDSAKAQVVWLNGMAPASDKPTYLDPTTSVPSDDSSGPSGSGNDPNSL